MVSSEQLLKFYLEQNEGLLNTVRERIDAIPKGTKIALWGCGHHISMLLAGTSLLEKQIVAVYDADERKRGMYIADVPIRPFDIEDLKSMKIEKVVVTTYTAQRSIESYIVKNGWDRGSFVFLYPSI